MDIAISKEKLEELCRDAFVDGYASADGHGTAPWEVSETKAQLAHSMTTPSLPSDKAEAMVEAALREHFAYDALTGDIVWKKGWGKTHAHAAGKPAFDSVTSEGYKHGKFCGKTMKAHRVAWFLHHGAWPKGIIDHVNGVKIDNRLENLRDVDRVVNGRNRNLSRNNTTGVNGVCYRAKYNNFAASMRDPDGNYNHLPDWLEEDMRRAWAAALSIPAPGTGVAEDDFWGSPGRTRMLERIAELEKALKDIAFLRPPGPTRSKLIEQMERIALNAMERVKS